MGSILTSIKKMLNVSENDTSFDTDIIIHINTALSILHQLGLGSSPFLISGKEETWTSLFGSSTNFEAVKTYIYLKVRLAFDPSASSVLTDSMKAQIAELEYRLNVTFEPREPISVLSDEEDSDGFIY